MCSAMLSVSVWRACCRRCLSHNASSSSSPLDAIRQQQQVRLGLHSHLRSRSALQQEETAQQMLRQRAPSVQVAREVLQQREMVHQVVLGARATLSRTFTSAEVLQFAAMTGDVNPAHLDDAFARSLCAPAAYQRAVGSQQPQSPHAEVCARDVEDFVPLSHMKLLSRSALFYFFFPVIPSFFFPCVLFPCLPVALFDTLPAPALLCCGWLRRRKKRSGWNLHCMRGPGLPCTEVRAPSSSDAASTECWSWVWCQPW